MTDSINPEGWTRLLSTYGPSAAALLVLVVGVSMAGNAMKDASRSDHLLMRRIYAANWIGFFVLLAVAVGSWFIFSIRHEFTIAGTLEHLQGSEGIFSKDVNTSYRLYLHKVYGPAGAYDLDWRLVSNSQLAPGTKELLVFDQSTQESERTADYDLTVDPAFYRDQVSLVYDRATGKMLLNCAGKKSWLEAATEAATQVPHHPLGFWVGTAYAQGTMRPQQTFTRLGSNDPIIRRQARFEVAQQGRAALPWIARVLGDPASTYQVRVGALLALGKIPQLHSDSLSTGTLAAIVDASAAVDTTLNSAGRRILTLAPGWSLAHAFEPRWQQAVNGPSDYRQRLCRSGLELYCALGSAERRTYSEQTPRDTRHLTGSNSAYRRARELRPHASASDQQNFAKMLPNGP